MMQIKFIGVPGESHQTLHMYGQDFPLGKAVEVTSPLAIRKLSAHPHFAHKHVDITDVEAKETEQEFTVLANAALEPIEAAHIAEALTVAALTDKDKYGNAATASDSNPAKAEDSGPAGNGNRTRRRVSS